MKKVLLLASSLLLLGGCCATLTPQGQLRTTYVFPMVRHYPAPRHYAKAPPPPKPVMRPQRPHAFERHRPQRFW